MAIRFINRRLVFTKKQKPMKGDLMCCLKTSSKKRHIKYHDGSRIAKSIANDKYTEKVTFMI